jgi:hypothetical protein
MKPLTPRRNRTPEEWHLIDQAKNLNAAVSAMLDAGKISLNQRSTMADRILHARLLAENGHVEEARQGIARIADMIAGWREEQGTQE